MKTLSNDSGTKTSFSYLSQRESVSANMDLVQSMPELDQLLSENQQSFHSGLFWSRANLVGSDIRAFFSKCGVASHQNSSSCSSSETTIDTAAGSGPPPVTPTRTPYSGGQKSKPFVKTSGWLAILGSALDVSLIIIFNIIGFIIGIIILYYLTSPNVKALFR